MILVSFCAIFPEIAKEETRSFHLLYTDEDQETPPLGTYSLIEMYCPDQDCDCRKVNIVIISAEDGRECGTIQFGWEDQAFYSNHFGFDEHELPGPCCAPAQPQGKHAHFFLKKFEELCVTDKDYVARLKRHYNLIKEKAKEQDLVQLMRIQAADRTTYRKTGNKIKRNDTCSCGSGKKYKKCCQA